MPCEFISQPQGGGMIICTRGRRPQRQPSCYSCSRPGLFQCDYPLNLVDTCDRYLCVFHRENRGVNIDYCLEHRPGINRR